MAFTDSDGNRLPFEDDPALYEDDNLDFGVGLSIAFFCSEDYPQDLGSDIWYVTAAENIAIALRQEYADNPELLVEKLEEVEHWLTFHLERRQKLVDPAD